MPISLINSNGSGNFSMINSLGLGKFTAISQPSTSIVTNGLILLLDASNINSYPGSGSTWFDISGQNAHCTATGNVVYVADGQKSYWSFPTFANTNYMSSSLSQNYVDITIAFLPDLTAGQASLVGLIASGVFSDKSLRYHKDVGNTIRNPGDANDWANPSATTFYNKGAVSNVVVSGWNIVGGYRTNQSSFPTSFAYHVGSGYTGRFFQGRMAFIAMYNRQLNQAEQIQNYNSLRSRFGL